MPIELSQTSVFFAGLILLIPHRIGMSRVNYVIKRYNLPISRAGLLLYKYHNNIELSLTFGMWIGLAIVSIVAESTGEAGDEHGEATDGEKNRNNKGTLKWFMILTLFLMLISSIIMFIIYISGGDFGHLNAFYFSLIFLTLFDGFTNAFAINAGWSSLLSAGIPLSGFLIPALHNIYKFFSDLFHWDDFDYYVLRLQLFLNIITILFAFILWSVDQIIDMYLIFTQSFDDSSSLGSDGCHEQSNFTKLIASTVKHDENTGGSGNCVHIITGNGFPGGLFTSNNEAQNLTPICMLAISLGTVYAFYPSIAPYSIIDFQYASIIELWILIISAISPLIFAMLDFISDMLDASNQSPPYWLGPSGLNLYGTSGNKILNWMPPNSNDRGYWCFNCVWISAIFYILCIQIFMSLLHYPHSLLSCFFNKPRRIGFISILFNTIRECMQACGFVGAGAQIQHGAGEGAGKRFLKEGNITKESGRINFKDGGFNDDIT